MEKFGTQIEAWAPFAEGRENYFENPVLKKIGEAHGKTLFPSYYDDETGAWLRSEPNAESVNCPK